VNPITIPQQKTLKKCHIRVPDLDHPISAISYGGSFYSYFKFYSTLESAQRGAERLMVRGDIVVLTQVSRGLVLWVFEPDARPTSLS
jgi:hypothetical protein